MGGLPVKAALAALSAVVMTAAVPSAAQAQCVWVPCPPQAAPQPALQPAPQPAARADDGAYDAGYEAGREQGRREAARSHRRSASSNYRPKARATASHPRRTSAAKSRGTGSAQAHRPARTRTAAHPAPRRQAAAHPAPRRQATAHPAPRRRVTQAAPPATNWTPSQRDVATSYGTSAGGNSINLANFTGRGERWVSSSGYRVVWTGPAQPVWNGGQLCGWGARADWSGAQVVRQSPAWVCQCAEGWRPPGH